MHSYKLFLDKPFTRAGSNLNMDVTLVMFKANGGRRGFPLKKPRTVIGRTNTCDLRIPLISVSREHCEIIVDDDHVVVRDLDSSNGTHLNQNVVDEATIEPGDQLAVGPVVFTVVIDGHPDQAEPVRSIVGAGPERNDNHQTGA